tara:strand:- start:31 stop:282 length:252 start_codon:yes stop_codon:yes gene_type:complete
MATKITPDQSKSMIKNARGIFIDNIQNKLCYAFPTVIAVGRKDFEDFTSVCKVIYLDDLSHFHMQYASALIEATPEEIVKWRK